MYIRTKEKSVRKKNLIGVFDLDNSTVSGITKNFLSAAEKANKIAGINILPKSFILTADKNINKNINRNNKSKDFKIYFSANLSGYLKSYINIEKTKT